MKNERLLVCKKCFIDTFNVSHNIIDHLVHNRSDTQIARLDGRGGRPNELLVKDLALRNCIKNHIDKFPRVESHFCRQTTQKQYLHPQLNIGIMHEMFKNEGNVCSRSLYANVFNDQNLAFHRPKKDQCPLCESYHAASDEDKLSLQQLYTDHQQEKEASRQMKDEAKKKANEDTTYIAATFDLQQVIFLPISQRGELFYKRQLSVYNETMYELHTKETYCYTWNETISSRGANEISSCVYDWLKVKDLQGAKHITLFADGCPGQNMNTILPAMLLYFLSISVNISSIELNFFEAHHGQSEGDSVHSTVTRAIKRAGDIQLPSELSAVMKTARRKPTPYNVRQLTSDDFFAWRNHAEALRIIKIRKSIDDDIINWRKMKRLAFYKTHPLTIFQSSSYIKDRKALELVPKRGIDLLVHPHLLNNGPIPMKKAKFADLQSFLKGDTPLIRTPEARQFYENLSHE